MTSNITLPPIAVPMEVDPVPSVSEPVNTNPKTESSPAVEPTDISTENVDDLTELLESVTSTDDSTSDSAETTNHKIKILKSIISEPQNRYGPTASSIKERAIYALSRAYCASGQMEEVVGLLTGETCAGFFENVTKAKCAKVVRAVLDAVMTNTENLDTQAKICNSIRAWCKSEKRTFLRQRVEAKLAFVLFYQEKYTQALSLINKLLVELKKLDDKQLLVETHLIEAKIHHGLQNVSKAKAALTASRTAANAIYVAPNLQSSIDGMSGTLHCEEGDYATAHSYFLEAFEQLDQLEETSKAVQTLKYMMLCKILDSLNKALKVSAKGGVVTLVQDKNQVDISGIISGRQGVKYGGKDIEAMTAIAEAASKRSLKEFENVIKKYDHELQDDLLIKHHLHILQEQLLESNLIRIIEPYSCVEIHHVANLMEMPIHKVERKLSQMILDGKFQGILDQGKGQLIVYDESQADMAMEKGLKVIANMDTVVSSLFGRVGALRTMMI